MQELKENLFPSQVSTIGFLEKRVKELEEETLVLRKEIKKREGETATQRAVLEQKNELLQKQIDDYKMRELNFKLFNENIFALLQELSSDKRLTNKDLIQKLEAHANDLHERKPRFSENSKHLEDENGHLKTEIKEKVGRISELERESVRQLKEMETRCRDLMKENRLLKSQVSILEEEKMKNKQDGMLSSDRRLHEYRVQMENLKSHYTKEIEELRQKYREENDFLSNTISSLRNELSNKSDSEFLKKEVARLNKSLNEAKKNFAEEGLALKRKYEEEKKKNEVLEGNLKKMRVSLQSINTMNENNNRILKEKVNLARDLMEQNERLQENERKNQAKIKELKNQIRKLERKDEPSLKESKVIHNTSKTDLLRTPTHSKTPSKISVGKNTKKEEEIKQKSSVKPGGKKSSRYDENHNCNRVFFDSKLEISPITKPNQINIDTTYDSYGDYLSTKPDKPEKIEKKPINLMNYYGISNPSYFSAKSEEETQNPISFESLAKPGTSKQNLRQRYNSSHSNNEEQSSQEEKPKNCENLFRAEIFKGNGSVIVEENEEFTKKTAVLFEEAPIPQNQPTEPQEFVTFNKLANKKLISQFLDLNISDPEEDSVRLKARIKELEHELESVVLELKQVKMEWALTEERKEETEVQLKNEIKYLLNKLIQAKNPNPNKNDDHSRNLSLNISGMKDNLKESIVSRTSRSRSPSIYKPPSSGVKITKGFLTVRNEEDDEFGDDNGKIYANNSVLAVKTMKDLNKGN